LEAGPLAVLSMWGDYASIVWSVPETEFDHLIKISDEEFRDELNNALSSESQNPSTIFGNYLGVNTKSEPPYVTKKINKKLKGKIGRGNHEQKIVIPFEHIISTVLLSREHRIDRGRGPYSAPNGRSRP
jgi:hypothetical protein